MMKRIQLSYLLFINFFLLFTSCKDQRVQDKNSPEKPYVFILGIAQDAGYPQANCEKECCERVYTDLSNRRMVSSIAIVDPISNEEWIFDATPDFTAQLKLLSTQVSERNNLPNGIFLTHAHIGHYTGIMYLGHEAMGGNKMPVYVMPKMKSFIEENGPWNQLVEKENVDLKELKKDSTIVLNKRISVTPIQVPHRDEYSETVGYLIDVSKKKVLFIPDIDKWFKWERSVVDYVKQVDIALLDATFFKNGEINRDMNEVPHPFVEESMNLFKGLSEANKNKVHFIHFNHTNPLLIDGSEAHKIVTKNGFHVAKQGTAISLH
jgi:pyrroloquinoline quinone biosynthesis protein B